MSGKRKQKVTRPRKTTSKRHHQAGSVISEIGEEDEPDDLDDPYEPDEPKQLIDGTEFRTIKCSLRSICNDTSRALPWDTLLKDLNKATKEALILANMHITRLIETRRPLPELDRNFFRRCLSAVSIGMMAPRRINDEDLIESAQLYRTWRNPEVAFANSAYTYGWFHYASVTMAANAKSHIVHNFYNRFQRYIKQRFDLTGTERYELIRDVLAPEYEGYDTHVVEMRRWIPRNLNGWIDYDNPHLILPVLYRFLRFIEVENFRRRHEPRYRQLRSFSLLPYKRGFVCSYFKMDKTGLHALLKRAGTPVPPQHTPVHGGLTWNDIADEMWFQLFDIRRFETQTWTFAGLIETDGKGVSIIMRKPARADPTVYFESEQPHPVIPNRGDFDQVWGVDPGRRDFFVATNNFGDTISCSSAEFYQDARYTSSNKMIRKWIDHNPQFQEANNLPSAKTCSLVSLHRHVRTLIPRIDVWLDFLITKPFRKLRFRRYVFKMRKLHALCRKFTTWFGDRTLVGVGDWSAQDSTGSIKRCRPGGPVKMFKHVLQQHCTVASIPEFRTSQPHAECCRELSYQYHLRVCRDGVERPVRVHRVLHCRHSGCFGMTVNRDTNASKNILLLTDFYLRYRSRHPAFVRDRVIEPR